MDFRLSDTDQRLRRGFGQNGHSLICALLIPRLSYWLLEKNVYIEKSVLQRAFGHLFGSGSV